MSKRYVMTSLTRIADLDCVPFTVQKIPRPQWEEGDYCAFRVTGMPNPLYRLEIASGRRVEMMEGDYGISALGTRYATLEGTGSWRDIGDDGRMHSLTGAGLLGRAGSVSALLPPFMTLQYTGHVMRADKKLRMSDFVRPANNAVFDKPVILLVGTSMSAGKTTTGRAIVHTLTQRGLRVAGAKFTGAARYHDILSFADAGADPVLDFVDAGLPSTVVAESVFKPAMAQLLSRLADCPADVLVAEAGASPLEPYNGAAAVAMLTPHVRMSVLCASDPYAVVGVRTAFGLEPDLVAGPAACTAAAIQLVHELTGVEAINIMSRGAPKQLRDRLQRVLPEFSIA